MFDKVTGSSEKLLINIAIILNKTNNFNIWCLYNKNQTTFIPKNILNSKNIYLYEYECDKLISKNVPNPYCLNKSFHCSFVLQLI